MTSPAADMPSVPCNRIRRVEAMFRDNRNSVDINKIEGKEENSVGLSRYRAAKRITTEREILADINISRTIDGKGTITAIKMMTTAIGKAICALFIRGLLWRRV